MLLLVLRIVKNEKLDVWLAYSGIIQILDFVSVSQSSYGDAYRMW
jgi:hypothetical protein